MAKDLLADLEPKYRDLLEPETKWGSLPSSINWDKSKESLPQSAKDAAYALTAPIHSPVETAKGLGKFGLEALKKSLHSQLRSWVNVLYDHDIGVSDTDVDKMVDHYSKRYGTPEGIKEAIENDPAGVIVDGLSVAYGAPSVLKVGKHAGAKMAPEGAPERMYESAAKFSTTMPSAERSQIINTLMENRIPLSEKGVSKTVDLISELNSKVEQVIADKEFGPAYPRHFPVRTLEKFANDQVGKLGGSKDARIIKKVLKDYLGDVEALGNKPMTLAELHQWKKDAYKRINWKNPTEDQNARNLAYKEAAGTARKDIEELTNGSDIAGINRQEGQLIDALDPLNKSVSRTRNANLIGLDKTLSPATYAGGAYAFGVHPGVGAGIGALKSWLGSPDMKSRLAIAMHHAGKPIDPAYERLTKAMAAAYLNSPTNRE